MRGTVTYMDNGGHKSSPSKVDASKAQAKPGKKKSKNDTVKHQIIGKTDELIHYLIKLRKFPFVCKTKRINKMSIQVVK